MFTRPTDLADADIVTTLQEGWGMEVACVEYAAVGFGSHHWRATTSSGDWFVTVDDLTTKDRDRLVAALATARQLSDAGRKRKFFTGALREAIIAIDPACGWLGCNLPAQIAEIDHLQPRSRGGPTDASNAKIMCDRHNIFKHTANYDVERRPDGTISITRPDGSVLRPPDAA